MGKLDTAGEEVLFSMPTVLRKRMRFTPGTYVWIEYVGESPSRHGNNPVKEFTVDFDDDTGQELPKDDDNDSRF